MLGSGVKNVPMSREQLPIRYADKDAHLAAVYEFIRVHKFDYDFKKFWKREPPKGIMRPFIKMDGQPNPDIVSRQVSSKPAQKQ